MEDDDISLESLHLNDLGSPQTETRDAAALPAATSACEIMYR